MGYRSEVAYMVKFYDEDEPEKAHADYLKFQQWVKTKHSVVREEEVENKLSINPTRYTYADAEKDFNSGEGGDSIFKWYDADNTLCLRAVWIKWYETYPEIIWHSQLLDEVKAYDTGTHRFVRLGEEDNDIEIQEHNAGTTDIYEKIYPVRYIEFHLPDETTNKEAA